jgi:hypothetical protein
LASIEEDRRPIAEVALQGMAAVRKRVKEENAKIVEAGGTPMPEASVLKMAEEMLPRLRVAEWRDRADAALRQIDTLDLRDLRSVVAAAGDPIVTRDASTRELADQLKVALRDRQEQELQLWFGDVDAALAVGRVVRALRLSSQPPKAGVVFPPAIATRLVDSTNATLTPLESTERWCAILEAAAFSPIRALIKPMGRPDVAADELLATVTRLAPAIPQIAELFGVEVAENAAMPKPLRPTRPGRENAPKKPGGRATDASRRRPKKDAETTSSADVDAEPAEPIVTPADADEVAAGNPTVDPGPEVTDTASTAETTEVVDDAETSAPADHATSSDDDSSENSALVPSEGSVPPDASDDPTG